MAEYASWQAFEGGNPGTGRGKLITTVRSAVEGIELSTELWVVRFDSFSIKGGEHDEHEPEDSEAEAEDFEEEEGLSDDDDVSWKVRRCAAKVLYTIISTRGSGDLLEDGTLYSKIAPVLVSRFNEREENVRLEILATMAILVRKTGENAEKYSSTFMDDNTHMSFIVPQSRKRRRGGSDASMFNTQAAISQSAGMTSPVAPSSPISGPRADLAQLSPILLDGITKLLNRSSIHTKEAAITLLKDVVNVQQGGLSEYLGQQASWMR